jgi:uncharacterized phage protein (TIGR02218 family)
MTYQASESSQRGGKPVELYRFARGSRIWLYTTADVPVTYLGDTYTPQVMRRGEMPQNEERDNATLDLFLDISLNVVAEFISGATPRPTTVTVLRKHRDEATPGEHAVMFMGTVGVVEMAEAEVHFTCVPLQKAIQRKLPRWLYQPQCNHMLYDAFCTVDPALFTSPGTITAIVNRTLTVVEAGAHIDGYYNGGFITDGETFAFIELHTGTQLQLLVLSGNIQVGDGITITAGCDRQATTCAAKFGNLPNFMGFPFMPDTNPYNGLM